jgi:DNA polymerase-3 subunit delta
MNVMKDDFKKIKKQKISKLVGDLKSPHTMVVDFDRINERDVKGFVRGYFNKRKISITESALERLIEIKGEDFVSVLFQLSKFEIATDDSRSIDSENIDEVITGMEAHSIWDLTDAIEKEDAVSYLKTLRYLFISGIKPTLVIGTLITHYNKIFTAKFLLDHHFPVSDIGKVLNQPSFVLNRFIGAVRNFSEKKIKHILDIIYKMDYESKTSGEESARLSLQNFIFQVGLLGKAR